MSAGVSRPVRVVPSRVWDAWVVEWVRWRTAAGHRPGTIGLGEYYVHRLRRTVDVPPDLLTTDELIRFLACPTWGPETRRAARTQVRGFFAWATRTGRIPSDPAAELPTVRVPRAVARPASETATERVCSGPDGRVRLAAILAGRMGLRRGEIAAARREHIRGGRLLVHGKGGHLRWVRVHPDAVALLPASGPLVPSLHTGGHLTPAHVGKLLSRALGDDGTAHMLRHRFATVAYRRTRDLSSVQAVLGHRSLTTTQRYIATDDDGQDGAVLAA